MCASTLSYILSPNPQLGFVRVVPCRHAPSIPFSHLWKLQVFDILERVNGAKPSDRVDKLLALVLLVLMVVGPEPGGSGAHCWRWAGIGVFFCQMQLAHEAA